MSAVHDRRAIAVPRGVARLAAWVALGACLLQLLAPIALAARGGDGSSLANALVICTPDGFRVLGTPDDDGAGDGTPADPRSERPFCPACVIAAHGILPPRQEFMPLVPPRVARSSQPAQERVADQRPARRHAVRAPPLG